MKNVLLMCSVLFALGGCAGTRLVAQDPLAIDKTDTFSYTVEHADRVTGEGMAIFKDTLESELRAASLLADAERAGKVIEIDFVNYRMRHGAARALAGALAGSDSIQTAVTIKNKAGGEAAGRFYVESKNPTAVGSARGLIEDHARKIVAHLKASGQ